MNLSELIDLHRGSRSYATLERDCGGAPSKGRLQQMVSQEIKNFPDPPTVRALARGLRVPESAVVLAAAESLGLEVRRPQPRLVELLPAGTDELSELQAAAVAHLVSTIVEPGAEAQAPEAEPTVSSVMEARARAIQQALDDSDGNAGKALKAARKSARSPDWLIAELEERVAGEVGTVERLASAARKGTPSLRGIKQEQDKAGEAPDSEGPEGGA